MLGCLSLDIICSSMLRVSPRSRKTVRSSDQIMATDKYPSLYNNQINARVLIALSAVGYCAGKPTEKSLVF